MYIHLIYLYDTLMYMYIHILYLYIHGSVNFIQFHKPTHRRKDAEVPLLGPGLERLSMTNTLNFATKTCRTERQSRLRVYVYTCMQGRGEKRGARLLVGVVDVDPAITTGSPLSHPWVTLGSFMGQPWVNLGHPWRNDGRFQ